MVATPKMPTAMEHAAAGVSFQRPLRQKGPPWRTAPTAGMLRSTPRPKRPDQQDVAGVDRQQGGGPPEQNGEQVEGDGTQDGGSGADEQDAGD